MTPASSPVPGAQRPRRTADNNSLPPTPPYPHPPFPQPSPESSLPSRTCSVCRQTLSGLSGLAHPYYNMPLFAPSELGSKRKPCGRGTDPATTQHLGTFSPQHPAQETRAGWIETSQHRRPMLVPSEPSRGCPGPSGAVLRAQPTEVPPSATQHPPLSDVLRAGLVSDPLGSARSSGLRRQRQLEAPGEPQIRAEAQLPPDGVQAPEGAGMCHCVPALPVGAKAFRKPGRWQLGLSLDHRPGRVCVPNPVTAPWASPAERDRNRQRRQTPTHRAHGRLSS